MKASQKKLIRWILIGIAIVCILFVVVGTPCLTCVQPIAITGDSEITLCVLVPLLLCVICGSLQEHFKVFSKQDALNQLDKQLNSGIIELEKYIELYEYIENLDTKKKQAKIEAEKRKYLFLKDAANKVEKEIVDTKEAIDLNQEEKPKKEKFNVDKIF